MEQAHLVGIYTPEEMPEELEGFVRYQAARDGHQMRPGERIAVLNVTGTSSYVPVFLGDLKGCDDLDSRLSQHGGPGGPGEHGLPAAGAAGDGPQLNHFPAIFIIQQKGKECFCEEKPFNRFTCFRVHLAIGGY